MSFHSQGFVIYSRLTPIGHSVEQNTYLEWVNSQYQNEFGPVLPSAKTCQDCHMPGGYTNAANNISVPQIQTRIASVEDDSYPAAEHSAPLDKIRVRAISVFGNRNRGSRIRTLGPAVRRAAGRRHRSPPPEQFVGDSPLEETVSSEPVSKNPISQGRPKRERAYKN